MTRTDLVVGGLVCTMLFSALLAADNVAQERDHRINCAKNLKQIGMAIMLYANENKGAFPRTRFDVEKADKVASFTNWKSSEPFGAGGPEGNDVSAALFLLLRTQDITSGVFICPSTHDLPIAFGKADGGGAGGQAADAKGEVDPVAAAEAPKAPPAAPAKPAAKPAGKPVAESAQQISNFPSPQNLSYSYANPYPSSQARSMGFKMNFTLSSDFAVVSDRNPGGKAVTTIKPEQMPPPSGGRSGNAPPSGQPWKFDETMKAANSPNHAGFGQNVLYGDGHVEFQPTPFCGSPRPVSGTPRDNIFTRHMDPVPGVTGNQSTNTDPTVGPAMDQYDSVMLPVAQPPAAKK